jgi:diacylglycerol kinase (ATP)
MKSDNFNLLNNLKYSINGFFEVLKNENAFKVEVVAFIVAQIIIFFLPFSLISKAILSISMFIIPLVEIINSAIERVVDLVTEDYHILAKHAKDAASAAVFVSILLNVSIWIWVFVIEFKG